MKEIRRQIQEHTFHKVYLLTGDEEYLLRQARQMLTSAMVADGDEMNFLLCEEAKVDFVGLREFAFTFPFFSEKRVAVLDRTGALKSGKDVLIEIFEGMPDTTTIILCENEVDKRSKVYKWIKKNGYVGEFLRKNQTEKILLRWVAALLKKEGKQIRESDARFFLERTGDDMYQIKTETEKLIAYAGEREEIRREDICAIVSGETPNKIFDLVTAIAKGEKEKALSYYDDLVVLREPPLRILFLIVRQYRILAVIRSMKDRNCPDGEIAKAAGIPPFALRRNEAQLKGYGADRLQKCIAACVDAEEKIKTGRIGDQLGVETLIVGLLAQADLSRTRRG